jgi:hypothetical protein
MDKVLLLIQQAWASVKGQLPAIVMALLSYEEAKVKRAELATDQAKLEAQTERNKNETLEKYDGRSDADVLRGAIVSGGGSDSDLVSLPEPGADPDRDPSA